MALNLSVTITSPTGSMPTVNRTFQVKGTYKLTSVVSPGSKNLTVDSGLTLSSKNVTVHFGTGGPAVKATFDPQNPSTWQCTGTVNPATPWGATITVVATAYVEVGLDEASAEASLTVNLPAAIKPKVTLDTFASPIIAAELPLTFSFTGSASSPQSPIQAVQYKVENGQFANAVNVSGDWSRWKITLPLPPTAPDKPHILTIHATDPFATFSDDISATFAVQVQPPIVVPPGAKTTLTGAPTTSSITSWTRLEPQCTDADMGTSSSARVFDPLWMLTRQWQMGEFQAEDAGTPVQARVRATTALLTRCYSGELPIPAAGTTAIAAPAYDPTRTPLEVLIERRRMRAADANEARMLTFAVDAGLHFLRMIELLQPLSRDYRPAFLAKLALQPLSAASATRVDDATARYVQSMAGRAPDGRQLAVLLRTAGAAQLVLDAALTIAQVDQPTIQQAATDWLAWYDSMYSEPTGHDAWNPSRLEYAVSVGARLSANAQDDLTFSATEVDGPIDWSSFDVNPRASLTTPADKRFTSVVEAVIPAPVHFRGSPSPRFWQMEDAHIAYGLVPVGPTDLAHLMMIEYASSYGNDWFVVPLELPIGSVTRVESLVVTDTFGVRNLLRPIGDGALPPAYFSLWQHAYSSPATATPGSSVATNRLFLPPTLSRTMDSAPLEDVLFMRDEMANLAWAIERTVESPIEQPARRYEMADAVPADPVSDASATPFPRYLLSSLVPPNWMPLLPVQLPSPAPNTAGPIISRLKLGAVLQPDGTKVVHRAVGDVLNSAAHLLLFDEEVPREGVHITRQRRLTRWTDGSTWLWTSFRNRLGEGEGSSGLQFDQVLDPRGTTGTS